MLSWFEKHGEVSWFITIIIAIVIFYVSSLTFLGPVGKSNIYSTLYHISSFFFFAFFLQIALVKGKNKKLILLAFLIATFYGVTDEFHQLFVPGRSANIFDVFIDAIGITYSALFYLITITYRDVKKKSL